jgi:hypothetical protein
VAFIPWPTALLAEHLRDSGANEHLAAAIYAGTFLVMGFAFFLLWSYAGRKDMLEADLDPSSIQRLVRRNLVGQSSYAIAFGIAWVSAITSFAICALVALYYVHPGPMLPWERGT